MLFGVDIISELSKTEEKERTELLELDLSLVSSIDGPFPLNDFLEAEEEERGRFINPNENRRATDDVSLSLEA